jgi:hypothetical protein
MRRIIFIVLAACTLTLSSHVGATAGWTDYVRVAELVPTSRHYYTVRLPVKENPSGCKNKTWFYQDYGLPGSVEMFQVLLEGVKSGIQIRLYVTGKCNIDGYAEISAVSVTP